MAIPALLFLPLSAQLDDPETVAWCRGVPLLVAEGLERTGAVRTGFAIWSTGSGPDLRLCHLQARASDEDVAAYGRAAGAEVALTGLASWQGDPFLRWDVVACDGRGLLRRLVVQGPPGGTSVALARAAFLAVADAIGLVGRELPPSLQQTESDDALLGWARDREAAWSRRRRGAPSEGGGFRWLLSALTCDPSYEIAARELLRRAGEALVGAGGSWEAERPWRADAVAALETTVRLRPGDHVAFTLLGMLLRADERDDLAEQALHAAVTLAPDYSPAHRELGAVLLDRGDPRRAGAHLRRAGSLAPRDPEVHLYLGGLYVHAHDRSRAADHLTAVLKLVPGTHTAGQAARLLRDLDAGPVRRVTNPLAVRRGSPDPRDEDRRAGRDRELISRTFGLDEVRPAAVAEAELGEGDLADATFTD